MLKFAAGVKNHKAKRTSFVKSVRDERRNTFLRTLLYLRLPSEPKASEGEEEIYFFASLRENSVADDSRFSCESRTPSPKRLFFVLSKTKKPSRSG